MEENKKHLLKDIQVWDFVTIQGLDSQCTSTPILMILFLAYAALVWKLILVILSSECS